MSLKTEIAQQILSFDMDAEVAKITAGIREILSKKVHRRGLVVAMSGGIDSSVSAALCVKAVGPGKVFGLLLPEQDSSSESESKGRVLAEHLGIEFLVHNIAPTLEAIGCYKWRDEAILVRMAQITGFQPAVHKGFRRRRVVAPVAQGDVPATGIQLTGFPGCTEAAVRTPDLDFHIGNRQPYRTQLLL